MANIKSAKKRAAQSLVRRMRNRAAKSKVHTSRRALDALLDGKHDKEKVLETYRQFQKTIDTVARKGILPKNRAARQKSRVMAKINEIFAKN